MSEHKMARVEATLKLELPKVSQKSGKNRYLFIMKPHSCPMPQPPIGIVTVLLGMNKSQRNVTQLQYLYAMSNNN
jgi:hypothetical protein